MSVIGFTQEASSAHPRAHLSAVAHGSLTTLFTSNTEAFEAEAAETGSGSRERPAAVFAAEENSVAPVPFFVAETCFDSEEDAENEPAWPSYDEDGGQNIS
jgi:hypothetical protein